jgi:hypothetical protein
VSKISTSVKKNRTGAHRNNVKRKAYRISFARYGTYLEIKYDLAEIKLGNMGVISILNQNKNFRTPSDKQISTSIKIKFFSNWCITVLSGKPSSFLLQGLATRNMLFNA